MEKPNKEPIPFNQRQDYKICLNCGFPNRKSDVHCMYCNAGLKEEVGFFSWLRQTYHVLRWRWHVNQRRSALAFFTLRTFGFFILGFTLSAAGLYLFIESISGNSFSNAMISVLFLFYGFYTLKALFSKK